MKDLDSLSLEEWDRVFAVNVRGLFQVTRGGCATSAFKKVVSSILEA